MYSRADTEYYHLKRVNSRNLKIELFHRRFTPAEFLFRVVVLRHLYRLYPRQKIHYRGFYLFAFLLPERLYTLKSSVHDIR